MMNAARYAVGMQGVAMAERAYQKAVAYARDRVQSAPGGRLAAGSRADHPPPRREAHADDDARLHRGLPRAWPSWLPRPTTRRIAHPDAEVRKQNQAFYEFMVPLVKGYSTEMSLEVTSLGVQVHGGMGFIEETGAAQYYRDARILTIYEGTTAIQANDLVGRKTARDGGGVARAIAAQIAGHRRPAAATRQRRLQGDAAQRLGAARQAFLRGGGLHRRAQPRAARTRSSPAACPT